MNMREIKFRAFVGKGHKRWNSEKDFMLSWEELVEDLHSELNPSKSVLGLALWYEGETTIKLMQYTNLKDTNGSEIYEGDIMSDPLPNGDPWTCAVRWEKESMYPVGMERYEIIGNVYENKELLA